MNKILILFLFISILNSCNKKNNSEELQKYDKNGNLIVYSEKVYAKMLTKNRNIKVTIIDTFCNNQKKRAEKDIKKGKLIYFRPNYLEFKKLSILLDKYGIETKHFLFSCVRNGDFEPYCYQEKMRDEINRKYGKKFIDSLTEIAKMQYINDNPNVAYIEDGKDLREKYLKK